MRNLPLVLLCLACAGHGRRVQSPIQRLQKSPVLDGYDAKSLASLLLATKAAAAFNPSLTPTSSRPSVLDRRNRQAVARGQRHFRTQMNVRDSLAEKTIVQTQIEEIIAKKPLVMFAKSICPFCAQAQKAFDEIGEEISVMNLDSMGPDVAAQVQDHLQTLTGARTVPRVFVGHEFIGGGTDVVNLQATGELRRMVNKALDDHDAELAGRSAAPIEKSEEEWMKELGSEVYRIVRKRGTEFPHSHEYNKFHPETGYFECVACDLPLYSASSKFRSNCGWPVFDKCFHSEEVGCHVDTRSDGSGSLEIICPKCTAHLGHVFFDAFSKENPNGERH